MLYELNIMSCIIKSCRNYKTRRPPEISFHQFPRDKKLQDCWLQALGIEPENFIRSPSKIVCSVHFLKEDFLEFLVKRTLKRNAVPSMHLHSAAPEFVDVNAESKISEIDNMWSSDQPPDTSASIKTGQMLKPHKHVNEDSTTFEWEEQTSTNNENIRNMVKIIHNYSMPPTSLKDENMELTRLLRQYRKRLYNAKKKIRTLEKKVTSLETVKNSLNKHIYLMMPPFSLN